MADWSIGQRFRFTLERDVAQTAVRGDGDPATTSEKRTEP